MTQSERRVPHPKAVEPTLGEAVLASAECGGGARDESGGEPLSMGQTAMLYMQRSAGNSAVTQLLRARGQAPQSSAIAPPLARQHFGGGTMTNPFPTAPAKPPATPEGASHGTPVDQMGVENWGDQQAIEPPEVPHQRSILVSEHMPRPVGWRYASEGRGGLEGTPYDFPDAEGHRPTGEPVMELSAETQRREAWGAYRAVVQEAVEANNALIGPIWAYKKYDPEIAQAGFVLPDIAEAALEKVVPRTNESKITVGSLFTPPAKGHGTPQVPGTEVQTHGLEAPMAQAKKSPKVEQLRMKIDAAELDVHGQLLEVKRVVLLSEQAGHQLKAAEAGVEHFEAGERKKEAEKKLEEAKAKAEEWKKWIERGLEAVALFSGALAPVVAIGAATAAAGEGGGHEAGGAAETVKSIAESPTTSTIASKIVDLASSGSIAAAARQVAQAEREMTEAEGKQVRETKAGAESGFAASLLAIEEAALKLKEKMKSREAALMEFGQGAAVASGAPQQTGDRIRAVVQAVPVVESVVAAADNIQTAVKWPPYSESSARGMHIAIYNGLDDPNQFRQLIGELKGYQKHYLGVRDEWKKRLTSLQGSINKMSASDAGGI